MIKVVVFDAYGTLFDVTAAAPARRGASRASPARAALAEVARRLAAKQLQYTWLRAITGAHADFAGHQDGARLGAGGGRRWRRRGSARAAAGALPRARRLSRGSRRCSRGCARAGRRRRSCRTARRRCSTRRCARPGSAAPARRGAVGRGGRRLQAGAGGLRPGRRSGSARAGGGAVRLVERLGRGRRRGLRLRARVWVNRGGEPARPAALAARTTCSPTSPACPTVARSPARGASPRRTGCRSPTATRAPGCRCCACPGSRRNGADFDPVAAAFAGGRAADPARPARPRRSQCDPTSQLQHPASRPATRWSCSTISGSARAVIFGTSRGGHDRDGARGAGAASGWRASILNDIGPEIAPGGIARILSYLGVRPPYATLDAAAAALARPVGGAVPRRVRGGLAGELRPGLARDAGGAGAALRSAAARRVRSSRRRTSTRGRSLAAVRRARGVPLRCCAARTRTSSRPRPRRRCGRAGRTWAIVEVPDRGHVPFLDEPEVGGGGRGVARARAAVTDITAIRAAAARARGGSGARRCSSSAALDGCAGRRVWSRRSACRSPARSRRAAAWAAVSAHAAGRRWRAACSPSPPATTRRASPGRPRRTARRR